MTCLTISIGNSSLSIALWEEAQCQQEWLLSTHVQKTLDEHRLTFESIFKEFKKAIDVSIVSSVVPGLTDKIIHVLRHHFDLTPLVVSLDLDHGLEKPLSKELGADLLANAVAAHTCYTGPCIVFDFGTALSITAVSGAGKVLGINIFPGITTAFNALLKHTALLHPVPLDTYASDKPLGTTTDESLQIGIIHGYVGVVSHIANTIEKKYNEPFHRIGTGGDSRYIMDKTKALHTIDYLHTLRGLRILAERNTET